MTPLIWQGKKDIRYGIVLDPRIEHGRDAVIKVSTRAICDSDLHFFDVSVYAAPPGRFRCRASMAN